ncbi:MAG: sugar ABC transporter ATP-binding protein [Rhodospirillaceae bacterium]|nr:sugar ABC transporter ATP-binding protein [Rhodospirillaceae bacterium]
MTGAEAGTVLEVHDATKAYGATVALAGVSLSVGRGEIHALLGENGAGKSTLVKILSGVVEPDGGTVMLDGQPFSPRNLNMARALGVSTAFQELSLLPNLTVAANLMLPSLPKGALGLVSQRRCVARAKEILATYGASDIAATALAGNLSLAEKQRVEIVRAVSRRPRVLILDEPTAALAEPEWLFALIEERRAEGCAILYISHRLSEVRRLCRRGTILRNGRSIATVDLTSTRDSEIFRMMVGASPESEGRRRDLHAKETGPAVLRVEGLVCRNVRGVSFDLHEGEVLGVAALEGQGQRDLFRALVGVERVQAGRIEVRGQVARLRSPAEALARGPGIAFVPEERKTEGVFLGMSTRANISLSIIDRLSRMGLIDRLREREQVGAEAHAVDLPKRHLHARLSVLSGGNQQKALIGRVLLSGARILVMFDPTRGVDVGTKQVIYGAIRRFTAEGGAVLIYSTEISELVNLCDRCLVLYRGSIVGALDRNALSEHALVALATGHAVEAAE